MYTLKDALRTLVPLQLGNDSKYLQTSIYQRRIQGRTRRMTLNQFPRMSIEGARRQVAKLTSVIADNRDPVLKRRRETAQRITLRETLAADHDAFGDNDAAAQRKSVPARIEGFHHNDAGRDCGKDLAGRCCGFRGPGWGNDEQAQA